MGNVRFRKRIICEVNKNERIRSRTSYHRYWFKGQIKVKDEEGKEKKSPMEFQKVKRNESDNTHKLALVTMAITTEERDIKL